MVQAAPQPFKFQEVFNLTTKGLSPDNFKMGLMTFESQKYICVKEGQVSDHPAVSTRPRQTATNALTKISFFFSLSKSQLSTPPTASMWTDVT